MHSLKINDPENINASEHIKVPENINDPELKISSLEFTYFEESRNVTDKLSAEFHRSDVTILTGASGCGKSTLLYLIAGIYPQEAGFIRGGEILLNGENPAQIPPQVRCRRAGMMFQNTELQFCMDTVFNEMIFCMENIGIDPREMDDRMDDALNFCGISGLKHRRLQSLSGGEKQKVMLACMTLINPEWMLLDEPFANVDEDSARHIAGKLAALNREHGTGIIAVDHRLDHWIGIADRILVMKNGRIEREIIAKNGGTGKPEDSRTDALKDGGLCKADMDFLIESGVSLPGRPYSPSLPVRRPGETAVSLRGFSVRIGEKEIVRGIDADFRRGVSYAILGESGCGKSTLFGALSGVYRYSGSARLYNNEFRRLKKKDIGRVGFVTQNPQDQFVGGTVKDEILASLGRCPDAEKLCEQILRGISLWRYRDVSPYMLSQGQQRRLGTAALMAYPCEVLFCDEPTYAQDRINTMAIMDMLCGQTAEKGAALVFSTHDRQLAFEYADVVYEMREGRLYEILRK